MLNLLKRPSTKNALLITLGILFVYVFSIRPLSPFQTLQLRMHDFFFLNSLRFKMPPPELQEIAIIALDDESYSRVNEKWPWDRSVYAKLTQKLSQQNPKMILLDVAFGGESRNPESDEQLAASFKEAGNVIIAYYLGDDGKAVLPLEKFRTVSLDSGYVNKPLDNDFTIRQAQAIKQTVQGEIYDIALEIKAASHLFDSEIVISDDKSQITFKQKGNEEPRYQGVHIPIPIRKDGTLFLNYQANRRSFTTYPVWEVLQDRLPPDSLKDKIVIFGITNRLMHDIHNSPFGVIPGVLIFANFLLMVLSGQYVTEIGLGANLLILLFSGFGVGVATYRFSLWRGFLFLFYFVLVLLVGTFFLYHQNIHWDFSGTLFGIILCYLGVTFYRYLCLLFENMALREEAITDGLTQLYTYRYFELRLRNEFERASRYHTPLSLIFIDIDHFKRINDTYGHEEGNEVLRTVAKILKDSTRRVDVVARYGGEEFCIILPQTDLEGAQQCAENLRQTVEKTPFPIQKSEPLKVTVSLGVSAYPEFPVTTSEELVKLTDLGVYQAKNTGRNQVCVAGKTFLKKEVP